MVKTYGYSVIFMLFCFEYMSGVSSEFYRSGFTYIPICDDDRELYIFGDQIVQVTRNAQTLEVGICVNTTRTLNATFDLDTVLVDVTELQIWDVQMWPPLPENNQIVRIDMSGVKPVGSFGDCSNLTSLRVASQNEFETPVDWLANCLQLREITLSLFSVVAARAVIDTVPQLRVLTIDAMYDWPRVIKEPIFPTPRGRQQSITEVHLTEIHYRYKWNDEVFARNQNTTWNEVSAAMVEQLSTLARLEEMSIRGIMHFDFCPHGNVSSVVFQSLRSLTISGTTTSRICFRQQRAAPQMTKLLIGYQSFVAKDRKTDEFEMKFKELFTTKAPTLFVDVWRGNTEWVKIVDFHVEEEDYYALIDGKKKANLTLPILRFSVDCDCQNAWFARAIREGLITAPEVACTDGRRPVDQLPEWLECDRVNCTEECKCRRDWQRQVLIADCSEAGLTSLPAEILTWKNHTELLVPDNNILTIPEHLPNNLQLLDLSNNAIWKINADELAALFAVKTRRVRLSGNPLVCTCDNRLTLETLMIHRQQIEDFDKIQCVGDKTKLEEANLMVLCEQQDREAALAAKRETDLIIAVSVSVALAAIILIIAVAFYYRRVICIYLFSKGWCLYCLKEDDLDADRRYDVFLSYCHEDHQLVHDKILPVLDKEYCVCEHSRDWCPGAMIPTQIMRSVELSKRTVVILSKNFVKSLWGVLEFRMAYASSLSERRVRVLMVVLDDVLDSNELHGELRAYVQLNTYVKWGDPWFWDKLRYSLPHLNGEFQANASYETQHSPSSQPSLVLAIVPFNSSTDFREQSEIIIS